MAGGVHDVAEVALPVPVLKHKAHGHALDGDPPLLLVDPGVGVPDVLLPLGVEGLEAVGLLHEHVHEESLPMLEVTD